MIGEKANKEVRELRFQDELNKAMAEQERIDRVRDSAPEMLEALEVIEDFFSQNTKFDDLSFRSMIQTAIKKAKGV